MITSVLSVVVVTNEDESRECGREESTDELALRFCCEEDEAMAGLWDAQ